LILISICSIYFSSWFSVFV